MPVLTAASALALHLPAAVAQTQGAETIAKIAHAITVRIEGATQGSGVLVNREGNLYTVLTAWHVVSSQNPGEELDIFTGDGAKHRVEDKSIRRAGNTDMAVLKFYSANIYQVASIQDGSQIGSGERIWTAGYPTEKAGKLVVNPGELVAQASFAMPDGYQILHTSSSSPGMSGGTILANNGNLIGIHGMGEFDYLKSYLSGTSLKTGVNQGIPIIYYNLLKNNLPIKASSLEPTTTDDLLVQARRLDGVGGSGEQVVRLTSKVIASKQSALAYYLRGNARKIQLRDENSAISDYTAAIQLNPRYTEAYLARASAYLMLKDWGSSIKDYTQIIHNGSINGDYYSPLARLGRAGALAAANKIDLALDDIEWILSRAISANYIAPSMLRATFRSMVSIYLKSGDRALTCKIAKQVHSQGYTVHDLLPPEYCLR